MSDVAITDYSNIKHSTRRIGEYQRCTADLYFPAFSEDFFRVGSILGRAFLAFGALSLGDLDLRFFA